MRQKCSNLREIAMENCCRFFFLQQTTRTKEVSHHHACIIACRELQLPVFFIHFKIAQFKRLNPRLDLDRYKNRFFFPHKVIKDAI